MAGKSHTIVRHEPGPRMSQAVIHNGTVYLAGQVAEGANVTEQTKRILAEIDRLLALSGSDKSRLLSAQIFLSDISTFAEMNKVWDAWVEVLYRISKDPSIHGASGHLLYVGKKG
jgi:enamine deaminase RidA (YjgF/YER057c/UK114 family)